jgi:protein-S-isoprenylcysteine O-methyltransferase Ste14
MASVDPDRAHDVQIQFARHNFDNHQNLIRFADTKAAAFVTLLVFLGASGIPIAKEAVPKLRFVICGGAVSSSLYLLSCLLFLVGFFWTLALVYLVIRPRGATYYGSPERGHELLFFGHVMLHANHEDYFAAVSAASPELLLRNLTDQVFELAKICQEKMQYLNSARHPMLLAFCSWAANLGVGLWIATWK